MQDIESDTEYDTRRRWRGSRPRGRNGARKFALSKAQVRPAQPDFTVLAVGWVQIGSFFDYFRRVGPRKPLSLNDDDFPMGSVEAVVVP